MTRAILVVVWLEISMGITRFGQLVGIDDLHSAPSQVTSGESAVVVVTGARLVEVAVVGVVWLSATVLAELHPDATRLGTSTAGTRSR
ncbi:MAG: hypothetical protein ACR2OI_01575 [Acidimicrobiia bacterium]